MPRPKVSAATYWRRRVVVLGVGAGVLTTLSWAVNGLLATGSTTGHAAAGHTTAERHAPASHHGHRAAPASSSAPSPTPAASHAPARHRHRDSRPAHASGSTPACAPGDVTLTVSSPQYWYQVGKAPQFTVRAAATGSQPCRFDMGARAVAVVIDSSGGRLVWNSADCAAGAASDPVVLASGSHGTLRVSWDRGTGCGDAGTPVRSGEYRVSAAAGADHSESVNIVLGAKGVTGP